MNSERNSESKEQARVHSDSQRGLADLNDPLVLIAFDGWNDAGDAASDLIKHLHMRYNADEVFTIDGEDFYDYTNQRPRLEISSHGRTISWPSISVAIGQIGTRDLVLISGPEPNFRWHEFMRQVVSLLRSLEPYLVVIVGAMLTDTPHSRPLPVWVSSEQEHIRDEYGLTSSDYEGPIGVVGALADACYRTTLPTISVWVAVPHYVASTPSPKATLALLHRLESLIDHPLVIGELEELSAAWERGVSELAESDPEIAEYISELEAETPESDLPQASGESIAAEFQRYLKRRREQ